jgi:hypothetical protein
MNIILSTFFKLNRMVTKFQIHGAERCLASITRTAAMKKILHQITNITFTSYSYTHYAVWKQYHSGYYRMNMHMSLIEPVQTMHSSPTALVLSGALKNFINT